MQKMLTKPDGREEVVKKVLFSDVLNKQLKENYSRLKRIEDKQIFTKVVSGQMIQKIHWIPKDNAVIYRGTKKSEPYNSLSVPKLRLVRLPKRVEQVVQKFYDDDSNSHMGAGKKEFITKNKLKKQKRYLLDTMRNLYKKFSANNFKISYQTFCRLRPFWIVKPNGQNRDTCLCIVHSNLDMKLSALYEAKILPYNNNQKLLEDLCCDRYSVECLSRSCMVCTNRTPSYKEFDDRKVMKYKMWMAERQAIQDLKTKKSRTVTMGLNKSFDVHPRQLIIQLNEDLEKFLAHERNIVHQFNAMKYLKINLQDEDVSITCITIDSQVIQKMINKIEKEATKQTGFKGTLNVHQVTGVFSNSILGPTSCTTLTMRSLNCFCNRNTCEHFKIGNIT